MELLKDYEYMDNKETQRRVWTLEWKIEEAEELLAELKEELTHREKELKQ